MSARRFLFVAAAFPLACSPKSAPVTKPVEIPATPVSLDTLAQGESRHGFRAEALYVDGADTPVGARFVHEPTGFVFDYLSIESAAQGFIWVNSFPTSDQGEPHTQEHLILGKGDRGRRFGNFQAMSLAESSAFTMQWRTCYHFHTVAGPDVFWGVFTDQLDALLHPDYTDEEIRREVANFGVSRDPAGTLRLEEKGTVYNEMVRTYENPVSLTWRAADHLLWGERHPLALSSGGFPADIRTMAPEDIRAFHRDHYYLGNMGMVGSFPKAMSLDDVLARTGATLVELSGRTGDAMTEADLPPPAGAASGGLHLVDYPYTDASQPSPVMMVWPAVRTLDLGERMLLELFLGAIAGDESTDLYRKIVDRESRAIDVGATAVWSWLSSELGQPVYIGFEGVAANALDEQRLGELRRVVLDELARIAALPAGSPELVALNQRVSSRWIDGRRRTAKFLSSPPGFGFRGAGSEWMTHLLDLEKEPGFRKSLTRAPQDVSIEAALAEAGNPWQARLAAWGLLESPHLLAARPSPGMRARLDRERQERLDAELARLQAVYGTPDAPSTLARYEADSAAATAALEASAAAAELPPFLDKPPMTLDDDLDFRVEELADGVPLVVSRIDSMTSSTVGLAFRLDGVPEEKLWLLALLPGLVSEAGLYEDGRAIPSAEVKEALRREVLGLEFDYAHDAASGRAELTVTASGNDLAETRAALRWTARLIAHPDWRPDNVARLRDVVEQAQNELRSRMLGAEEGWVDDPAKFWWRQSWPLFAHSASFLTRMHDLHRLRWRLAGDDAVTREAVAKLLEQLGEAAAPDRAARIELTEALEGAGKDTGANLGRWKDPIARLSAGGRALVAMAGKDLRTLLADLPDDSLAADWTYLCRQMAGDLRRGPAETLANLEGVRRAVFAAGNARIWLVGSSSEGESLRGDLESLLAVLEPGAPARPAYAATPLVRERLRARQPAAADAVFVGLVNPNTASGVFQHSAPAASFASRDEEALLDYLAGNLFTGHGGHSIFMKTWAAGLAYSNGLRPSLRSGRMNYYAERSPELPTTLSFVIAELRRAQVDPGLVDYALAEAFSSRVAAGYEERASAIAADLADGVTPERVRELRTALLALRGRERLADELFARLESVYGRVLPGWGPRPADVEDAVYFTIGPDAQLDAWARYLAGTLGPDAILYRLYPRDFWAVAP